MNVMNNIGDKFDKNFVTTKSRLNLMISEIEIYLKDTDQSKESLYRPSDRYEVTEWLYRLCTLTNSISDICIESVEGEYDRRWQVSYYLFNKKANKGYTIILDSSAEDIQIESIKELAEVIITYEDEANSLILLIKE